MDFRKTVTVKELKEFLKDIPDETEVELWDAGEACLESLIMEYETWEHLDSSMLSLEIETKNSIY